MDIGRRELRPIGSNARSGCGPGHVHVLGRRWLCCVVPDDGRAATELLAVSPKRLLISPDPRDRRKRKKPQSKPPAVRTGPSPDDQHQVVFFKRHRSDNAAETEPGRAALNSYPAKVRATMRAALAAVASAPPKRFAAGSYWEAMKGGMTGWLSSASTGQAATTTDSSALLDYDAKASKSHC